MRGLLLVLAAALVGAVWGTPAYAQSASADFNGDGYTDLAVGVPNEDLTLISPIANAGAVHVFYGSSAGLTTTTVPQMWTEGGGIQVGAGENFGAALAAGDLNGDGYADLAVGAPGEDVFTGVNVPDAGSVFLIYGSASGLTAPGGLPIQWHQDSDGIADTAEAGDRFGSVLVAANFGKGARTDLAIGVQNEDVATVVDAGAVSILFGRASGLTAEGDQFLHQDTSGIANRAQTNDFFGGALAAGNVGKSSHADLAVGAPGEALGTHGDAGGVSVLYGSSNGLTGAGDQFWHQGVRGIGGAIEAGDRFGSALAVANFGKGAFADLAVGAQTESVGGADLAGAVTVIYGRSTGLTATGDQTWTQNTPGISGTAEQDDRFGFALAAANFGKSGYADLAIGAPQEGVQGAVRAGAVHVLYGSSTGLAAAGDQVWHQGLTSITDDPEIDDLFAWALSSGNFGGSSHRDLAVGAPGEGVGAAAHAGAAHVIFGRSTGLSASGEEFWHQDSAGVTDTAEPDDFFGTAVAR
jgi:FG-GAP repeat